MLIAEILIVVFIAGTFGYLIGRMEVRSTRKQLREFYKEALQAQENRITELTLDNDMLRKSLQPPKKNA